MHLPADLPMLLTGRHGRRARQRPINQQAGESFFRLVRESAQFDEHRHGQSHRSTPRTDKQWVELAIE